MAANAKRASKVIRLNDAVQINNSDLVIEEVNITPEMAGNWLQCNRHNRPARRSHVAFLANEILSGHWQVNGQAIVIAEDDEVLDGQHRLMAIIEAGRPARSLVIYGVSPEAFKTIDTGAVRTGADALVLHFPEASPVIVKAVASAVRWCVRIERQFHGVSAKISNSEIIEYTESHPSLFHCAEILNGYPKDGRPVSLACATALYEMFSRKDAALADSFMRKFYTGEQIGLQEPEFVLRQMLIKDAQRLQGYPAEIKMKMCVKAWNWRRRGRDDAPRQVIAMSPHDPARLAVL